MHWCSICTLTWTNMGHDQLLFGTLSGIHFLACDSHISNVVRPKGRISFWLSCPCLVLLPFGILEYSWIACSQFLETLEVRSNPGGISRCPDLQVAAVICLTCLQSCVKKSTKTDDRYHSSMIVGFKWETARPTSPNLTHLTQQPCSNSLFYKTEVSPQVLKSLFALFEHVLVRCCKQQVLSASATSIQILCVGEFELWSGTEMQSPYFS